MPKYFKAVRFGDLITHSGWKLNENGATEAPADDEIVYLNESLHVVLHPFERAPVLFDSVTEDWRALCVSLGFAVPDWSQESAAVRNAVSQGTEDVPA